MQEKSTILRYWIKRNGSSVFSKKIEKESRNAIKRVSQHALLGKEVEDFENVRQLTVLSDYSIFYTVAENKIIVLSFWDNRRDPKDRKFESTIDWLNGEQYGANFWV